MEPVINKEVVAKEEAIISKRERVIRYYQPWKAIFFMCAPTVLIMLILSTYNLVDKLLALKFADQYVMDKFLQNLQMDIITMKRTAKDIINVATQYSTSTIGLIMAFSLFVAIGTSTRFGIAYGQQNRKLMAKNIGNGVTLTLILTIVLTPILSSINKLIISWQAQGVTESNDHINKVILELAANYTKWFAFLMVFILFSTFLINLLRTEGRGLWATMIILSSVIVNIILDIVLMVYGKLGLEGAAIATLISYVWNIVFALLIIYFDKNSKLKITLQDLIIDWKIIGNIVAIGLSPFFINVSLAITAAMSNYFVRHLSDVLPKEHIKVSWVVQLFAGIAPWIILTDAPLIGISQGSRALLSYCYGAKKYQRIWEILKRVILIQFLILLVTEVVIGLFGNQMLGIFISNVDFSYRWYFLLSYLVYPSIVVPYIGIIFYQSISRPKLSLFFSSLRSVIVTIPCMIIGYQVALVTKDAHYYFLFLGLIGPISALISAPILAFTWKKYRHYLGVHRLPTSFAK